ncbi:hypothetical protein HMI54_015579 [Coelomomyces lativittatus]|nr:hypothetical protein HMI55_004876 [Coelomomyces lativittatus]KAJ1512654.1 hypothetical protein HMI54_015579 [Coelomomyces lativittatus]
MRSTQLLCLMFLIIQSLMIYSLEASPIDRNQASYEAEESDEMIVDHLDEVSDYGAVIVD